MSGIIDFNVTFIYVRKDICNLWKEDQSTACSGLLVLLKSLSQVGGGANRVWKDFFQKLNLLNITYNSNYVYISSLFTEWMSPSL